ARSKNASVSGGASSGSRHAAAPDFFFLGMTVPHRNNVAGVATLRPDHDHQPAVEMARRDEAGFAVCEPVIDDGRRSAGKQLVGPREIESAMPQREIALRWIEGDLHELNVPPIISLRKPPIHPPARR